MNLGWKTKTGRLNIEKRNRLAAKRNQTPRLVGWKPRFEIRNLVRIEGRARLLDFNQQFRESPVKRTKRRGLLRNIAIAMGNSGEAKYRGQLHAWAQDDDPVLAEAATWSLARLGGPEGPGADRAEPE